MFDTQTGETATSGDAGAQPRSDDAQQLTKADVREAAREGVDEALGDRDGTDDADAVEGAASDDAEDSSGGRFTLRRLLAFGTVATISYLLRRRRRSSPEPSQSDQE